tara:strand:- start:372 stop:620 length:249 start_codon:yes stop_codon:yes gene_type:complete
MNLMVNDMQANENNFGAISMNINVSTNVLHSLNEILKVLESQDDDNPNTQYHIQQLRVFIINAENTFKGKPTRIESYEEWKT